MTLKRKSLLGGINRFRLMLTLVLAVLLPAAALIYVNFAQLRSFERDGFLQAAIHRDFQEALALYEKQMNKKIYAQVDDLREIFPSADAEAAEKEAKLDELLSRSSSLTHAFIFDEDNFIFRTHPAQRDDKYVRAEEDRMIESYRAWFSSKSEVKSLLEGFAMRPHHILFSSDHTKRADGVGYLLTALFLLPAND